MKLYIVYVRNTFLRKQTLKLVLFSYAGFMFFFKITYRTKDVFVVQKGNVVMIPSA